MGHILIRERQAKSLLRYKALHFIFSNHCVIIFNLLIVSRRGDLLVALRSHANSKFEVAYNLRSTRVQLINHDLQERSL